MSKDQDGDYDKKIDEISFKKSHVDNLGYNVVFLVNRSLRNMEFYSDVVK